MPAIVPRKQPVDRRMAVQRQQIDALGLGAGAAVRRSPGPGTRRASRAVAARCSPSSVGCTGSGNWCRIVAAERRAQAAPTGDDTLHHLAQRPVGVLGLHRCGNAGGKMMAVERHEHSRRLEFMQRRRGVFDLLPVLAVVVFVGFDQMPRRSPATRIAGMEVGERGWTRATPAAPAWCRSSPAASRDGIARLRPTHWCGRNPIAYWQARPHRPRKARQWPITRPAVPASPLPPAASVDRSRPTNPFEVRAT